MGELKRMDLSFNKKKLRHGDKWGNWRYDEMRVELVYDDGYSRRYGIRLEECVTPGGLLVWLYQLLGKTWLSNEDLRDLLHAFDDMLDVRCNLVDSSIKDMKRHLSKRSYLERKEEANKVKSEYRIYGRKQNMAEEEDFIPLEGSVVKAEQVAQMIKRLRARECRLAEQLERQGTSRNRLEDIITQMSHNPNGKWE